MKKKAIALALSALMITGLVGCEIILLRKVQEMHN